MIPLIQGPPRLPTPKLAVQETLLILLRQFFTSKSFDSPGAGSSRLADTTVISSKPDINIGSTYDEYLNKISQDLEKCEEKGPPLNKSIAEFFQNLAYNDINVEKFENLLKEVLPPKNINGLEANKVNSEIWQQIAQQTKSFDRKLQNLQKLILKFL